MTYDKQALQHRALIGALIFMATTIGAAIFEWELPDVVSRHLLLVIAALGGAVAGRVLAEPDQRMLAHVAAMIGGALGAIGGFYAVAWWVAGRSSVGIESGAAMLIGATPGLLVGAFLYGRLRRRPDPVPPAKLRG
jgi:hypothetical protein